MSNVKVAVYGTLKAGFHNNYLLENCRRIGVFKSVAPFTMYSRGGFPILSLDSDTGKSHVTVEIYIVPEEVLKNRLDRLEGYPDWYDRSIQLFFQDTMAGPVEAWIYHQNGNHNLPIVEDGIWKNRF